MLFKCDDKFEMFYEEIPSSAVQPTIYVHGNLGSNHWWYPLMTETRNNWSSEMTESSFLIEFRGCARSEWHSGQGEKYSFAKVVEDIASFIQKMNLQKVNLVGHSTGGFISMLLAATYSDLVGKVVLIDPVNHLGLDFSDELNQVYELMKADATLVEKVIRKTVYLKNNIDPQLWTEIIHWVQVSVRRLGSDIPNALRGVDFTQQFSKIFNDVLIIHGSRDRLIFQQSSENLRDILPSVEMTVLADIGHSPNLETPSVVAQKIRAFFVK